MKLKGPNPIDEAENEAENLANGPATPNPSDIQHAKVCVSCCLPALFQSYGLHIMVIIKVSSLTCCIPKQVLLSVTVSALIRKSPVPCIVARLW